METLTTQTKHYRNSRQPENIRGTQNWQWAVQDISGFRRHVPLYGRNKRSTKRPLELIREFGEVATYRIHAQKPKALTQQFHSWERKRKIRSTQNGCKRRFRYLGINVAKDVTETLWWFKIKNFKERSRRRYPKNRKILYDHRFVESIKSEIYTIEKSTDSMWSQSKRSNIYMLFLFVVVVS